MKEKVKVAFAGIVGALCFWAMAVMFLIVTGG